MNPHFFYNALNTLQSYILSNDKKQALNYLSKFSNLTRTILELTEKDTISIAEEVKTLSLYLEIEKARFDDDFDYHTFVDLGNLMWCAMAVGTCEAVKKYCIQYANERTAFGEPISHRQSVAFMIADMAIEIDAMQMLIFNAASLAESGQPFHREAYLARLLCAEKSMKIGTDGVQILGGHGFTKEHPVERWYRDLRATAIVHSGLHV